MESMGGRLELEMRQKLADNIKQKEFEVFNKKTVEAVNRIKAKLQGNDFRNCSNLSTTEQVDLLIRQATLDENIAQAYLGWNPFL